MGVLPPRNLGKLNHGAGVWRRWSCWSSPRWGVTLIPPRTLEPESQQAELRRCHSERGPPGGRALQAPKPKRDPDRGWPLSTAGGMLARVCLYLYLVACIRGGVPISSRWSPSWPNGSYHIMLPDDTGLKVVSSGNFVSWTVLRLGIQSSSRADIFFPS